MFFTMRYILLLSLIFVALSCKGAIQGDSPIRSDMKMKSPEQIYECNRQWVDSVYLKLSPDDRIAQLFWLAIENPDNKTTYQKNIQLIKNYKPGGIILFEMSPVRAVEVISEMQNSSELPLFVSVDGENGLSMRFSGLVAFPKAMSLGAIQNNDLIYCLGLEIARQCKVMGIHVNLAPVADVNVNPLNPVIGIRSFGENPDNVAGKVVAYMHGLQDGDIMAVGKHFPGHGDTDTDSHKTLPYVTHDRHKLDSVDLYPFRSMIDSCLWAIMSAHLEVPALEKKKGLPASFSKSILIDELRDSLNFRGLIITDAVNMQGAKLMGNPGVIDALAIAAGNDVVEFTENLPVAIVQVKKAIKEGLLTWDDIEIKCKRSLAFKKELVLKPSQSLSSGSMLSVLNSYKARNLNQQLYEASVTILNNKNGVLPFDLNSDKKTACIVIGDAPAFITGFKEKSDIPLFQLSSTDGSAFDKVLNSVGKFERYILVIADSRWGRLNDNQARKARVLKLSENNSSVVLFMGNAYHLKSWEQLKDTEALALVYQDTEEAQEAILRFLMGEIKANGRLPVSVGDIYKAGDGVVL